MRTGNLRNGAIAVGTVSYEVQELHNSAGTWSSGRFYTSDQNHLKISLAAEDLYLDDHAIEITGETHDDGSLTFRAR
jgi:hypothetical protein